MNQQPQNLANPAGRQIQIKVSDEVLAGKYANAMQVSHKKEEFVMDFININSPQGIINSRVITTPGHMKRIIKALQENLEQYEKTFGKIEEAEAPKSKIGFNDRG